MRQTLLRTLTWLVAAGLLVAVVWAVLAALALEDRPGVLPTAVQEGEEIVVRSSDGPELRFAAPPRRVLPINASTVDLLDALVEPDRIAALPDQAATWSRILEDDPRYRDHRRFARYDAELVMSLAPDLVISGAFNSPETNARIRECGIPVLRLEVRNGLDEVRDALRMLGTLMGVPERAEAEIIALEERQRALAERARPLTGRSILSYSNLGTGGWSFGAKSTMHEVFGLAGMVNAGAAGDRSGSVPLSFEELVSLDPDYILVSGAGEGVNAASTSARVLRGEEGLSDLKAIRRDAIIVLPPRLTSSSSQEMLTAAEALVDAILAHDARREGAGAGAGAGAEDESR